MAKGIAEAYHLDPLIVAAQIWTESDGNPWATRYEPDWRYFWKIGPLYDKTKSRDTNRRVALNLLGPTEFHLQSTGLGIMQVMGAVARERGMKDDLSQLYAPAVGIRYGCLHLSILLKASGGEVNKAVERYNNSAVYLEQVMRRRAILGGT